MYWISAVATKPTVDIVVVNYKTYPLIQSFVDSYTRNMPKTVESRIILIDNESSDADLQALDLSELVEPVVIGSVENLGYARACNKGASLSDSDYIVLMNSDVEFVDSDCVDLCISYLEENPDVGIVGPFQFCIDSGVKKVTNAGILGPGDKPKHRGWKDSDTNKYRFRRTAWNAIMEDPIFRQFWPDAEGAMPEHELYYEDTVLCYAMPKFGYRVVYLGEAELMHQWHQTISVHGDNSAFEKSRTQFRVLMDAWGIVHD
jgi:GT2 family glycosyltransferase